MARNSRFQTTSGPSSNRPSDKKRSFKKDKGSPSSGTREEFKRPYKERKFTSKQSSPKPLEKGKPFQKRESSHKTSEPKGVKGDSGSKEFAERQPRSFSKEGRSNPHAGGGSNYVGKRGKPKQSGESDRKKYDEPKPGGLPLKEKKSFIESRLDRQRKVRPIENEIPDTPKDGLIRLNRFISNSGVCSRREADDLIKMGLITVNGKSITEMGYKVKPTDDVRHDGKRLKAEMPVYILLNKPKGFITTTDDPQERNTVMQLVAGACKERVYPVGRLDRNTSGLLLLTNDGDLTEKLSHPSYNIKKIYKAELDRPLTKNDFQKVLDGVRLEEGKAVVDDLAIVSDDGKTVGLEIHIGWNRIVRRIFEAVGYDVVKLDRSVYATLDKKDLPRGHWRFLRQDEVIRLKHFQ